jgi:hypothetical protein
MRALVLRGVLLLGLCGCAHMFEEDARETPSAAAARATNAGDDENFVRRDGFKLWREKWEDDENQVRSKASFDLNCKGGSLKLQVLELMSGPGRDDWAKSIGVVGCGSRARYTRIVERNSTGSWFLESKAAGEPQAPPDGAPKPAPGQPTTL